MRNHIIETVADLIQKYGTRDPFIICDHLNVKIHYHDLNKELKGYYIQHKGIANIVIDINLPYVQNKIVCGHELGHHCIHGLKQAAFTDIYRSDVHSETAANLFSAELYFDDDQLIEDMRYHDYYSLSSFANMYEVPAWFLECKLHLLNAKGYDFDYQYLIHNDSLSYHRDNEVF